MASERRLSQVATTIPVRNVQALAARSADELPAETLDRYIRPGIDQDAVLEEHSDELPVVDLGRLLNPESWEEEAAKLRFACEEWGFFQVYMSLKNQNYRQCSWWQNNHLFIVYILLIILINKIVVVLPIYWFLNTWLFSIVFVISMILFVKN
jgi:hypothetical protein